MALYISKNKSPIILLCAGLLLIGGALWSVTLFAGGAGNAKPAKQFASKPVTKQTPGHAVDIDVDVAGAKKLFLVVTDAGNGYGCDWADWAEPRLIGPKGELKLTDLKWKSATASWGKVRVNKNAGGGAMRIAGKAVPYGIGTHANSVIVFDLPKGYTHFKARGGLDNGGTDQAGGGASSVQFFVHVDKLPAKVAQLTKGGGNQRGGGLEPDDALDALDVGDGLEAQIFAAEPMLLSPSNIDIDPKGRVWVCEVVNYRRRNGQRPEGDRILILEDTDGDGHADKKKVFYQGRDIDSAHGICLLPTVDGKNNKVIVSVGQGVYIFTDKDGDDKADDKTTMFTGVSGTQHDHGIHAFLFGPDGKLYFNFGNSGNQIRDANGKQIVDMSGNVVTANRRPYQEGMVFRCDMDGSNLETLGWNFRNNWEVTVDSFGTIWQSDNDDDGNKGVRINYVMEFGNYGYRDEINGAGWRAPRTGMHEEVPKRHWHLRDPGVVPNLLQTGAGSPTGIMVYEGDLLPKVFHNQPIHCDAGPNITRAYPTTKDGAGYKAIEVDILRGTRDKWYRPSDVCAAPDGSLIIADWYDPGVGGHAMGDVTRGRLFRIAPPNTKYTIPTFDFSTPEGAAKALRNPALSVRYMAWTALHKMQAKAEPALLKMFAVTEPAHLRARALWLLGKIAGKEKHYLAAAFADKNADIRIVGLRMARQHKSDVLVAIAQLANDPSPQVRRECALAMNYLKGDDVIPLWVELAAQHDGKDRWYLEALGIAARRRWDACLASWLEKVGDNWNTPAGRDIIWRSRGTRTPEFLMKIIADPKTTRAELPRYFRAFDFQSGDEKNVALMSLAFNEPKGDADRKAFISAEAITRLKNFNINSNTKHKAALDRVLKRAEGTAQFVKLVSRFNVAHRYGDLLQLAQAHPQEQLGVDAMTALLDKNQFDAIGMAIQLKDEKKALATVTALASTKDARVQKLLLPLVRDKKADLAIRREAVRALGGIQPGAQKLVQLAAMNKLDPQLKETAGAALHQLNWRKIQDQVAKLFPLPKGKNNQKLPPISQLLSMKGDMKRGLKLFQTTATCAKCHVVGKEGKEVGPNLTEIGDKLSLEGMYQSILFPSAAISHNYETYFVELNNGTVLSGILVSKTPQAVTLKDKDAITRNLKQSDVVTLAKQSVSLMPADLPKLMTAQELADVVAYLRTLRKKSK